MSRKKSTRMESRSNQPQGKEGIGEILFADLKWEAPIFITKHSNHFPLQCLNIKPAQDNLIVSPGVHE